jgi:hypothetical protein
MSNLTNLNEIDKEIENVYDFMINTIADKTLSQNEITEITEEKKKIIKILENQYPLKNIEIPVKFTNQGKKCQEWSSVDKEKYPYDINTCQIIDESNKLKCFVKQTNDKSKYKLEDCDNVKQNIQSLINTNEILYKKFNKNSEYTKENYIEIILKIIKQIEHNYNKQFDRQIENISNIKTLIEQQKSQIHLNKKNISLGTDYNSRNKNAYDKLENKHLIQQGNLEELINLSEHRNDVLVEIKEHLKNLLYTLGMAIIIIGIIKTYKKKMINPLTI